MGKQRTLADLQRQYSKAASTQQSGGMGGPGPGRGPGGGPRRGAHAKGKPKNTAHTVKRLWHYLSNYKWRLVMVIFCMLFSTFTALAGSYMLRPIINNIAAAGTPAAERVSYLAMILIVLACIYAVGVLSNYLQGRLMLSISQNAVEKLRNDLFDKIQKNKCYY